MYAHVLRQSPEFFEVTQTGEVLSRLTTDTTLIQTVVGTSISMALRNVLLLIGGLLMMFFTSVKLSAIIIVMLLAVILPIVTIGRRVRKLSRASQDRIADASGLAGDWWQVSDPLLGWNSNATTSIFICTTAAIERARCSSIGWMLRAWLPILGFRSVLN